MNKPLFISAPSVGIAPSAFKGFQDVRNLDLSTFPGVAILNNILAKASSTTVVTRVQWMVKNPTAPAEVYALDSAGKVYRSGDSGATWALMTGFGSSGAGQGLAIWKNYLFVARTTALDVCGDGAASGNGTTTGIANANWTNDWTTNALSSDALWHPMIVSKNDNKLYIGAGRYVFSLDEASGQTFAPGNSATYTMTEQALDLPPNYRIKCIEELGNNLMCGTWQGTNVYDLRIADIFPWDRSSPSFGQPITMNENGVHALLNIGNALAVFAGIEGQVYISDGVSATPIAIIPSSITNISGGKYIEFLPGAVANFKKKIFFGVSSGGTSTAIPGMGVYSLQRTSRGNILLHEHTISEGSDGDGEILNIGALLPITRDELLVSWRSATTYGIDKTTNTSYNTSYGGYFISPMYRVGTSDQTRKFQEAEINLARPLRTGEGVKLSYRNDLTDSFTDFLTLDFATYGAELSHTTILSKPTFDIPASELLQVKVSVAGTTTTTPEVMGVILR